MTPPDVSGTPGAPGANRVPAYFDDEQALHRIEELLAIYRTVEPEVQKYAISQFRLLAHILDKRGVHHFRIQNAAELIQSAWDKLAGDKKKRTFVTGESITPSIENMKSPEERMRLYFFGQIRGEVRNIIKLEETNSLYDYVDADEGAGLGDNKAPTPEEIVAEKILHIRLEAHLFNSAPDLVDFYRACCAGYLRPAEQADFLGRPITQIYRQGARLRNIVEKFLRDQ